MQALRAMDFAIDETRGDGSHAMVYRLDEPSLRTSLPKRDPVAAGTLRAMLRDLQISRDEFARHL